MNRPMNHIGNPMNHMKHNETAHETAHDTARNLMNRSGHHLEPLEPTMNHIGNPMTNMTHHEPAHDTTSKLHEPEGPLSFSNRPAHADPRICIGRNCSCPAGRHLDSCPTGSPQGEPGLQRKQKRTGSETERRKKKGITRQRPLTERRKERSLGWKKGKNKEKVTSIYPRPA
jgi:hypothetical protein